MNKARSKSQEQPTRRNIPSPSEVKAKQRDEEQYEEAIKNLNRMGEREIDRTLAGVAS